MSKYEFGMAGYGRGGAGNFNNVAQANLRAAQDTEAQRSRTASDDHGWSVTDYMQRQEPSYIGRGGAGNFGSPVDSSAEPNDDAGSASLIKIRPESQPTSPTYGRGGAGNFAASAITRQSTSRKTTQDELIREKLNKDIEEGVNESLAVPAKARLAPPQRAKLPDDIPV